MASITNDEAWSKLQTFGPNVGNGGMDMSGSQLWAAESEVEAHKGRDIVDLQRGRGIDTVFLLDCSESLGASGFAKMKDTFYVILESITSASFDFARQENVAIVTFGENTKVLCHLTNDYDLVRNCVASCTFGGRSPLLGGLYMALAALVARGSATVLNGCRKDARIILLSDGKPTDSKTCSGQDNPQTSEIVLDPIIYMATRLGADNHDITCIPVGDADEAFLKSIATASSGRLIPQEEAFRIGRYFKNLTTLTRMKRNSSLYANDRQKFCRTVASIDTDANDWDIEDMCQILRDTNNLDDVKEDEDEILNPNMPLPGTRVRRGPHWRWGNQDHNGPGTIVRHLMDVGWIAVQWDYNHHTGRYRFGADDCYDLEITREPRVLRDELIAPGCMVTRGPDWNYGPQDGGIGEVGVVFNVTPEGIARVRWPNGHINRYRYGFDGQFELKIWTPEVKYSIEESEREDAIQQGTTTKDDAKEVKEMLSFKRESSFDDSESTKVLDKLTMRSSSPILRSDDDLFASGPESDSTASPQPKKKSDTLLWQFQHGNEWIYFGDDDNRKISKAENTQRKSVVLQDGQFRISFGQMTMYDNDTHQETPIRKFELPTEISGMDTKKVDLYFDAMESGKGQSRNIRLMIVGHEGVGKTSMCHNLLKKGNVADIRSTNGIEIFIHRYEVNLSLRKTKELHCTEEEISKNKICDMLASWPIKTEVNQSEEESMSMESNQELASCPAATLRQMSMPKESVQNPATSSVNIDPQELTKKVHSSRSIAEYGESSLMSSKWNRINTTTKSLRHDFKTRMEEFDFTNDIKDVIQKLPTEPRSEEEGDKAYLSVWDFGGEEVFYDTHHIFLSTDAVYLVVFNVKECQGDRQKTERVQFWLRSIGTLGAGGSVMDTIPPIIMVGTHIDQLEGTETQKNRMFIELCDKLFAPNDLQTMKNVIYSYIAVDNTNSDHRGFTELWDAISVSAPRQSQWGKDLPAKWLALERDLLKMKSQGHNIMTFGDVMELAKKCEAPITKDEEIEVFLNYLNKTGNILFFDDTEHMKDGLIVLNPQWIVNAFKLLITASKFADFDNTNMETFWKMYHINAELTLPLIDALWKEKQFKDHRSVLLNLMEKMGLIARPVRFATTKKESFTHYIVPTILKQPGCEWLRPILEDPNVISTRTLCFVFSFIPFTIFHKLIAMCIAQYKTAKEQLDEDCLQKDFGCFMVDSQWFIALTYKNSTVKATMFKFVADKESVPSGICVPTRKFLDNALRKILAVHHLQDVRYTYAVHCDFQNRYNQKLVSVGDLLSTKDGDRNLLCCRNPKTHFIDLENLYPWFEEDELKNIDN